MLTADELRKRIRQWADAGAYRRGMNYFLESRVRKWSEDTNAADRYTIVSGDVKGSEIYETLLSVDPADGEIYYSECSCPYGEGCKHAVALGLAYAESLEKKSGSTFTPNPHTTKEGGASPLNETLIREALSQLGLSADTIPEALLGQLLHYRKPAAKQKTAPVAKPPAPKSFKPNEYFIVLDHHRGYSPTLHTKGEYGQTSLTTALKQPHLTPTQRDLLSYLKAGKFDDYRSARPDLTQLFPLLAAAGFPLYKNFPQHDTKPITIDQHPLPLNAELIYAPKPMFDEETRVRHDLFLRMPDAYWKNSSYASPFIVAGEFVIHDTDKALAMHRLTPLLTGLISRMETVYNGDWNRPKVLYHQARLTGNEAARFDEIVADATCYLSLTAAPPTLTAQPCTDEPIKALAVAFDNSAQTLRIEPIVDYGIYEQNVADTVHMHRPQYGRHITEHRGVYEHPGGYIVTVENNIIHTAKIDDKKETRWYTELSENAEAFGFTKKLRCERKGAKQLTKFLSDHWPKLSAYAHEKGYPIFFEKDELAVAQSTFRADFAADINAENDWLHFDVSCYCGEEKVTLEKLLAYLASGDPFWRKADGTLVEISNRAELERLARLLKSFHARENGGYEGSLRNAPELEYVMTSSPHYNAERAKSFKQFLSRIESGKPVKKVTIPAKLAKILRPYQKAGIEWMYFLRSYRFAGILADDMGLGKTLQTLCVLDREKVKGKPSLVICPKTLLYNWQQEAAKFFPNLTTLVYDGSVAEREALQAEIPTHDLIIASYNTVKKDEELFAASDLRFNYAVLDEAQFIKNHATKNAQVVKKLNADYRLALTGTPLENSVSELWSIYDFLMPDFLGNYKHFAEHFHRPIMDAGDKKALEHLRRKIGSFMLRRTKAEVLKELPPKIETASQCHLSDAQNVLYQQILAKVRGDVFQAVEKKGFKSAQIHILAGLTKLRQACNHPALLTKGSDFREYESAKLDMCLELVDEVVENKRKVLIFSQFTQMLDIVSAALDDANVPHLYLSGKTKNRQDMVNQFNTDPAIPVFLISLKAGGTGLNLTAADTVIIFDPWWNPSVENQAVDRAHRIGQQKTVNVYRLLTTGTIEEKIQLLKEKKQLLFDSLVDESGDAFKKLTWNDVRELFAE